MPENRIDLEKTEAFFKGLDNDFDYIREIFTDKSREEELKKVLRNKWYELSQEQIKEEKSLDHILYKIHFKINTDKELFEKKSKLAGLAKWCLKVAAIMFIPLAIYSGINFFNTLKTRESSIVEIKAPAWTRAEFTLPDSTKVWLNNRSSIKYNTRFNNNRMVILTGEAFFDVTRTHKKPFKVITGEIMATVLGTKFNIASYDDEKTAEIVLEEGSLLFSDIRGRDKNYLMKPADLLIFDKTNKEFKVEEVQPEKYSAWREGKLVFRNDPVEVIKKRLERWYNIDVEVKGDFGDDLRLRATFVDESLEEVVKVMKGVLHIDYIIEEQKITSGGVFTRKKLTILN